jgi:hypothetical protein
MTERKEWNICPPSLDKSLWDKIPADRKQDFFTLAAKQLRAGFHPNTTARKYLVDLGIIQPSAPSGPPSGFSDQRKAALLKSLGQKPLQSALTEPSDVSATSFSQNISNKPSKGFKRSVSPVVNDEEANDFDFDDDFTLPSKIVSDLPDFDEDADRKPTRPFGLRSLPSVGDVPKGKLGHAIHRLLGLPGDPGKKAAEAEASVLSAIVADPVYAELEPTQLGNLGCSVPEYVLAAIEDLILDEVRAVKADIAARKENEDPTVIDWLPPDEW